MAGGHATKEIAKRYPVTDGLTAGTTTQEGHQENLIATEGTNVEERYTKLMRK
jgi:hypothetical protein